MLSIKDKVHEIFENLKSEGFKGYSLPEIEKECIDEWSYDYAIFYNAYLEYDFYDEYFDSERLKYDFRDYIKSWFKDDPTVAINFRINDTEIEFYRKTEV